MRSSNCTLKVFPLILLAKCAPDCLHQNLPDLMNSLKILFLNLSPIGGHSFWHCHIGLVWKMINELVIQFSQGRVLEIKSFLTIDSGWKIPSILILALRIPLVPGNRHLFSNWHMEELLGCTYKVLYVFRMYLMVDNRKESHFLACCMNFLNCLFTVF